jgi:hypothetical protein
MAIHMHENGTLVTVAPSAFTTSITMLADHLQRSRRLFSRRAADDDSRGGWAEMSRNGQHQDARLAARAGQQQSNSPFVLKNAKGERPPTRRQRLEGNR